MINKTTLKSGSSKGQNNLELNMTPITVFVGPNNSEKSKLLTATYKGMRIQDSGSESMDFSVYEFTDITDSEGKKIKDKWIKETKLLKAVPFRKGNKYKIKLIS